MKKNKTTVMILITTLSLSANAEYYSIVKGLNKTYLDGNINISYSE